ncbi:hypothetical protein PLICRDRAFT_430093 [Plicaturopsis crispa FD-325 SS-3]|uniref:F-box domain-containing protein n=1 Tax=Plicaturopsis crispa FD-325 SS-3 TaxID=944288 RepID=A0A0C9T3J1_PLICR|nr:hypothetical protein PLICRDRAFT_430093 [Plicaturopsis crispa FD-325 SS-3]
MRFSSGAPSNALLLAASNIPTLDELSVKARRWQGPQLSAFSHFTHLRRLGLFVGKWPHSGTIYYDQMSELLNVQAYLRVLAPQLFELEISGDICELSTLVSNSWPHLRSLTMSGHGTTWTQAALTTAVARMPSLRKLHMNLAAPCKGPWQQPSAFIYSSPNHASPVRLPEVLPHLESLALSNVHTPSDTILDQLPDCLVCLHVLANYDYIRSYDPQTYLLWPRRYPLSEPDAFRIVQHTARMKALTELMLSLDFLPTVQLVRAIAASSPHLRVLQLEYTRYNERIPRTEHVSSLVCTHTLPNSLF